MELAEIKCELDSKSVELCALSSTFSALDIAMREGSSVLDENTFLIPCNELESISKSIAELVIALYEKGAV